MCRAFVRQLTIVQLVKKFRWMQPKLCSFHPYNTNIWCSVESTGPTISVNSHVMRRPFGLLLQWLLRIKVAGLFFNGAKAHNRPRHFQKFDPDTPLPYLSTPRQRPSSPPYVFASYPWSSHMLSSINFIFSTFILILLYYPFWLLNWPIVIS